MFLDSSDKIPKSTSKKCKIFTCTWFFTWLCCWARSLALAVLGFLIPVVKYQKVQVKNCKCNNTTTA